jgi:exodeoxyribonuclease VII small subunit
MMTANPDRFAAAEAANPAQSAESAELSFETSLAELNDLVNRLESGTLGLSDSIGAYERGVTILRQLHEQLADVEERVRLLVRIDDQGRPILTDIGAASAEASTSAQTQPRRAPRSAPRTGRPKRLPGMDDAGEDV